MYTYNRDIYVYTYIYIYVCMIYMYTHIINVCVYILLNGVNAYLTFGTGFSFFHFPPPPPHLLCCLFFVCHSSRYRFSGTSCQRVSRDTIRVYTLAHAMLFMCIRDRLFRTMDAGDKREIEKRQLYR